MFLPHHRILHGRVMRPWQLRSLPKACVDGPSDPSRFTQSSVVTGIGEQIVQPGIKAKRHCVGVFAFHNDGGGVDTYLVQVMFRDASYRPFQLGSSVGRLNGSAVGIGRGY
jgi:hypothetical protein